MLYAQGLEQEMTGHIVLALQQGTMQYHTTIHVAHGPEAVCHAAKREEGLTFLFGAEAGLYLSAQAKSLTVLKLSHAE